jgi:DNA-binding HxlR family transcriptional regulator
VLAQACPVREVLDRVAGKWSVLIIVAAAHGPVRFTEPERSIEGIGRRMLTPTLRNLERDGLVTRTVHPTVPPKVEYELTPVARELRATLLSLTDWAERHRVTIAESRAAYDAEHRPELVDVWALRCPAGSEAERPRVGDQRLEGVPGPRHQAALGEVHQSADPGDLGGHRAVGLPDGLFDAETLALAPEEGARHLDLVTGPQFAQVADGRLQRDRAHPAGRQVRLADPGRPERRPAGVLGVLEVDALVEMAQHIGLVPADGHGDGERLCHDFPFGDDC